MGPQTIGAFVFCALVAGLIAAAVSTTGYQASAELTYRTPDLDPETVRVLGLQPQPAVHVATGLSDSVLASSLHVREEAANVAARASGTPVAEGLPRTTVRSADPIAGRVAVLRRGPRGLRVENTSSDPDAAVRWVNAFAAELARQRRILVDRMAARRRDTAPVPLRQEVSIVQIVERANLRLTEPARRAEPSGPGRARFGLVTAAVVLWLGAISWWLACRLREPYRASRRAADRTLRARAAPPR